MRPDGVLDLSLPDKRFMFDAARPLSTLAELVDADLLAYERPSPRQPFAHTYEARAVNPERIWAGQDPHAMPRLCGDTALAFAHVQAVEVQASDADLPCHCWVFTPASFLDRIEAATRLRLFPFVLNQLSATEPGSVEFYASMRRDAEAEALQTMQEGAIAHLRGVLGRRRAGSDRTPALASGADSSPGWAPRRTSAR